MGYTVSARGSESDYTASGFSFFVIFATRHDPNFYIFDILHLCFLLGWPLLWGCCITAVSSGLFSCHLCGCVYSH